MTKALVYAFNPSVPHLKRMVEMSVCVSGNTKGSQFDLLAANTRLLVAPEEGLRRSLLPRVDKHGTYRVSTCLGPTILPMVMLTGLQTHANALGTFNILAPDASTETGVGVVCPANDLLLI